MRQRDNRSIVDTILYVAVGGVLTYFFATPLKTYFTELVRPTIEQALGERETKSHSVRWHVEPE